MGLDKILCENSNKLWLDQNLNLPNVSMQLLKFFPRMFLVSFCLIKIKKKAASTMCDL